MYVVNREKVIEIMIEKKIKVRDFVAGGMSGGTITRILKDRVEVGHHVNTVFKLSRILGVEPETIATYK